MTKAAGVSISKPLGSKAFWPPVRRFTQTVKRLRRLAGQSCPDTRLIASCGSLVDALALANSAEPWTGTIVFELAGFLCAEISRERAETAFGLEAKVDAAKTLAADVGAGPATLLAIALLEQWICEGAQPGADAADAFTIDLAQRMLTRPRGASLADDVVISPAMEAEALEHLAAARPASADGRAAAVNMLVHLMPGREASARIMISALSDYLHELFHSGLTTAGAAQLQLVRKSRAARQRKSLARMRAAARERGLGSAL